MTAVATRTRSGLPVPATRRTWRWARVLLGAAVLVVLVWRLGTGPFVDGLRQVDLRVLLVGAVVGIVTTVCSAGRWRIVARDLGVDLPMPTAVAFSYRAQFLNATLPGGILGDVHRGVRHGVDSGDVGRGLRAVAWDRACGQVVQVALTIVALTLLPSPFAPGVLVLVVVTAGLVLAVLLTHGRARPSRYGTVARATLADLRALVSRRSWPVVAAASALAVAGYVTMFLVATAAVGVDASPAELVPLALLVLLAMSIPANVAGWGPREGVAAWAFAAAGLGASAGVSASVVYGVMSLVATLPGAVVLVAAWLRRPSVLLEGARHG